MLEGLNAAVSALNVTEKRVSQTAHNLANASTPAYRPPMEAIGRGDLQPELNRLSKAGKWQELGAHIDEDFLAAFTTRGKPEQIAGKLLEQYGKHADRLAIYAPYAAPDDMWKKIVEELKREKQ